MAKSFIMPVKTLDLSANPIRRFSWGSQELYRFPNKFGASVVQHEGVNSGSHELYELMPIYWPDENDWTFAFGTLASDDFRNYLNETEVVELLAEIANWPTDKPFEHYPGELLVC